MEDAPIISPEEDASMRGSPRAGPHFSWKAAGIFAHTKYWHSPAWAGVEYGRHGCRMWQGHMGHRTCRSPLWVSVCHTGDQDPRVCPESSQAGSPALSRLHAGPAPHTGRHNEQTPPGLLQDQGKQWGCGDAGCPSTLLSCPVTGRALPCSHRL